MRKFESIHLACVAFFGVSFIFWIGSYLMLRAGGEIRIGPGTTGKRFVHVGKPYRIAALIYRPLALLDYNISGIDVSFSNIEWGGSL